MIPIELAFAAMLLLLLGYVILCAMCVGGDKANDSEHSDL